MKSSRFALLATGLLLLAALASNPAAAAGCASKAAIEVSLTLTPGEYAGPERDLNIAVHTDGCVDLQLPAFRTDRGHYQLQLQPAELASLRLELEQPRLPTQQQLEQAIEGAAQQRGSNGSLFAVHDGDLLVLRIAANARQLRLTGPKQLAAQYPEIAELAEVVRLQERLERLMTDTRRQAVAGGTP